MGGPADRENYSRENSNEVDVFKEQEVRGKDVRDSSSPPRKSETWADSASKTQTLLTTHGLSDLAGSYLVTPDIASILSSKGRGEKMFASLQVCGGGSSIRAKGLIKYARDGKVRENFVPERLRRPRVIFSS